MALHILALSTRGVYAVKREWPERGTWALKLIATNPEYTSIANSIVVPVTKGGPVWQAVKYYFHMPTESEVAATLEGEGVKLAGQ